MVVVFRDIIIKVFLSHSWHASVKSIIHSLHIVKVVWVVVHIEPGRVECKVSELIVFNTILICINHVHSWLDISNLK